MNSKEVNNNKKRKSCIERKCLKYKEINKKLFLIFMIMKSIWIKCWCMLKQKYEIINHRAI